MISRIYEAFIVSLAVIAGGMILGTCAAIVFDVCVRALGGQPPYWTSAASEYALIFIVLLAAPWLVRRKGHVFTQLLSDALPERARRWLHKIVYLVCLVICAIIVVAAAVATHEAYVRNEFDIRAVIIPIWILYAPMVLSFSLMSIEFGRFLIGLDTMYDEPVTSRESM